MRTKAITKELAREFAPSSMRDLTETEMNLVSGAVHSNNDVRPQGNVEGEVTVTHTFGGGAGMDISVKIEVTTGN
ncbi:hypothetical protein LPH44_12040 (plasmid) [Xylella taiwanensis]|uniref:Uncharacterized protein n=1 Tax=Xylella taiwanensis TaxID=1444770 RepID=A0ABS8TYU0_9GAMM|nr:hypothetical protein [Xylella taiwanensis]MCD8459796.1 hypothetical protein [Xylella taiwanensis]MCD8474186.1 hypothetical protein [Xylella taiwanensis]UFN08025.1 hypothetical protein LPH42_12060 [Xylella taiwanensis]UFN10318.1 hypothetical protein LPH45_12065 [Xylella taiwanensis]UFN12606.1 hypothetical protein LPH44_12040 [Xylella taiwanensis]